MDTIKLLKECDAGTKMGISSIDDVLDNVCNSTFKQKLENSKKEHEIIEKDIQNLLLKYHDEGKDPNMIAKGMSWIETNMKILMNDSDKTIADIMTDGCNMGIKSLKKYVNQYSQANQEAKDIASRLIQAEAKLVEDIAQYL